MKIAMVFPTRESEKAISGYSTTLVENIKKTGADIESFTYTSGSPKTLFRKLKALKKYDIIHIQHEYNLLGNYGLPFFLLYFSLFFSNAKIVTTMHTILSRNEKFKGSRIKTILRKILYFTQNRWINWFSDIIVVHAGFFKDIFSKEYNVPRSKIHIFYQGIIEDVPEYNKNKIKKELGLSGPVYLIIGTLDPLHGQDIIIRDANNIGKTILVVGNPSSLNNRNSEKIEEYIEYNKKIVEENNYEKFVRFDISSDITDKNPLWWKYFSAADLVLLSYRGGIGSGIFAHSIAAQKPIIASNIQYFNEIAKNFHGIKIAKSDKDYPSVIKEAMKPQNYKRMVKECKKYLKEHGLSVVASEYKKLYTSLK